MSLTRKRAGILSGWLRAEDCDCGGENVIRKTYS